MIPVRKPPARASACRWRRARRLPSDICYLECNTLTAGPCAQGACVRTLYHDNSQAERMLKMCASPCDPLATGPCGAGEACVLRAVASAGTEPQHGGPAYTGETTWACVQESLVYGTVALGHPCSQPDDCEPGLLCYYDSTGGAPTACRVPCAPGNEAMCAGEACLALPSGSQHACALPPGSAGAACTPGSCAEGLTCAYYDEELCRESGCCVPAGGDGEPCYEDSTCDGELSCVDVMGGTGMRRICANAGGEGEACFGSWECDYGLGCFGSSALCATVNPCCVKAGGYHERCLGSNPDDSQPSGFCNAGLVCALDDGCNADLTSCCVIDSERLFGLPCASGGECALGLSCTSTGCPYPTADCCLPTGKGDDHQPCNDDGSCSAGFVCVAQTSAHTNACGNGLPSCCLPAGGPGEPCLAGDTCESEWLTCTTSDDTHLRCEPGLESCCTPPPCNAGSCSAYPGTSCIMSPMLCGHGASSECCMPAGGADQVCRQRELPQCDPGLVCAPYIEGGRCVPGGAEGQPCLDGQECNPGLTCQWQDGTMTTSICVPGGGEGEPCITPNSDCDIGLTCLNDEVWCADVPNKRCCLLVDTGKAGQACNSSAPACADGLDCVSTGCPYETSDCCMPVATGGFEEACNAGDSCDSDALRCIDFGTGNGCSNGLKKCCIEAGYVGAPCRAGGTCADASLTCSTESCDPAYPDCCRAPVCSINLPGQCTKSNGKVCLSNMVCQPNGACCLPAGSLGEACYDSAESERCDAGSQCLYAPGGSGLCPSFLGECCMHVGDLDEPCPQSGQCNGDLACVYNSRFCGTLSNCCTEAGDAGQPCLPPNGNTCHAGNLCIWGSNSPCADLGLFWCCLDAGEIDGPCNSDEPCTTGTCAPHADCPQWIKDIGGQCCK